MSNAKSTKPAFSPVVKRKLILPQVKFEADKPVYIRITAKIFTGKEIDAKQDKPAQICHCVNLETGEDSQIVVPAVVEGVLNDEYATAVTNDDGEVTGHTDQTYIGLCFMITKGQKPEGKRYFQYQVCEIEDPAGE